MSADNVEIVHELLDVWVASGTDAMAARFRASDVAYEDDPAWPDRRAVPGRKAVVRRFDDRLEAWGGELEATVEWAVGKDDRVAAIFVVQTQGISSGVRQRHGWGYVFERRNGLVTHFRAYLVPTEALRAAGV